MQRKRNPYARTYLFQTDGSAALKAQEVMDESNHKAREEAPQKKQPLMLSVPVWGLLLAAAVVVFILAILLLNMSSTASQIHKEIYDLRQAEQRAKENIEALEVQIAQAEAPEYVQNIAVNRLEMRRPTEEEIIYIPFVDDFLHTETEEEPVHEQGGILQYLLSLLGL